MFFSGPRCGFRRHCIVHAYATYLRDLGAWGATGWVCDRRVLRSASARCGRRSSYIGSIAASLQCGAVLTDAVAVVDAVWSRGPGAWLWPRRRRACEQGLGQRRLGASRAAESAAGGRRKPHRAVGRRCRCETRATRRRTASRSSTGQPMSARCAASSRLIAFQSTRPHAPPTHAADRRRRPTLICQFTIASFVSR